MTPHDPKLDLIVEISSGRETGRKALSELRRPPNVADCTWSVRESNVDIKNLPLDRQLEIKARGWILLTNVVGDIVNVAHQQS
jgi:hypothetical protein